MNAEIQSWSDVTAEALYNLWVGFIKFLPALIGALVIFIVGWFVSVWSGKLVAELLKRLKFDKIFERGNWEEALEKADFKMSVSDFIGGIVKWVLVIVFLLAAVEILGLNQFAAFLRSIVGWLPNLVIATAIFVVAVVVADFAEKLVKAAVSKMDVRYTGLAGAFVKYSIWVFAILAILSQLGVASEIIQILVAGFVALIVISTSLAFGLGGRDLARDILENFRNKLQQ